MRNSSFRILLGLTTVVMVATFGQSAQGINHNTEKFAIDCANAVGAFLNEGFSHQRILARAKKVNSGPDSFQLDEEHSPWGGYYFPMARGGIATRWQSRNGAGDYKLISEGRSQREVLAELQGMSKAELNELSPAEKFDVYMGYYDFRVAKYERTVRGPERRPKPEGWEGFCNGRCAAAVNLPEPEKVITVTNADGVEVTFQINDLKALGAADYFYVERYAQLGVPSGSRREAIEAPPNAGAFDVLLRSFLAENQRPFLFDIHNGNETWNSTAIGYKRKLGEIFDIAELGNRPAGLPPSAKKYVDVELELLYHQEISLDQAGQPTRALIARNAPGYNRTLDLKYRLYLDSGDNIVEGEWSGERSPDFVWFAAGAGFDDEMGGNPYLNSVKIEALFRKAAR